MPRIKSLALTQYGSVTKFAKAMCWSVSKASRILCGTQDPGLEDIKGMIPVLGLSEHQVLSIFFDL